MSKSKLRKKILKIRQITTTKDIKINFRKVLNILKKEAITNKNIGGYYPINFEVDIFVGGIQQKPAFLADDPQPI